MKIHIKLTVVIQEDPEGGYFGFISELPGINTQGETEKEVRIKLFEALKFSMDYHREQSEKMLNKKKRGIIREEFNLVKG